MQYESQAGTHLGDLIRISMLDSAESQVLSSDSLRVRTEKVRKVPHAFCNPLRVLVAIDATYLFEIGVFRYGKRKRATEAFPSSCTPGSYHLRCRDWRRDRDQRASFRDGSSWRL